MKCAANNCACAVYDAFLETEHQYYGLPSNVPCDQGSENSYVGWHMIDHRGVDQYSVIMGNSVHYQHIEQFWRDMHTCVIQLFYHLFYYMEHQDLLEATNESYFFALCYVYLKRIYFALQGLQYPWNKN